MRVPPPATIVEPALDLTPVVLGADPCIMVVDIFTHGYEYNSLSSVSGMPGMRKPSSRTSRSFRAQLYTAAAIAEPLGRLSLLI